MSAPTRRDLLAGASVAMVAASAAVLPVIAGAEPADNCDGELLSACAAFQAVYRAEHSTASISDDEANELVVEFYSTLGEVEALTPKTAEGLRAKALAGYSALMDQVYISTTEDWREQASAEERVALDALCAVFEGHAHADVSPDLAADADLIRACAQHCINMDAYNESDEINRLFESSGKPLWAAYSETRDFIAGAKPRTLAGILAKARAAKHEAGADQYGGSIGGGWALDIVNDLLRLNRGAA